ncbi:MAG: manganese-dependent inorganic pyrophosphatase [Thermodesulfobacteriaceae bacterium]|nr:manganese-dependent inorganic pyrophosphatase [Thermodesulfobacteriaceae bacterium]MCX8041899.1 manganese-dependent inorganic pyrophosphatase [Thermodesulfobacteriaceae bacterium]MDW8135381.1 manganese-dependent inorganic pyrophosphatase [Thermodesulfobacterium sp.]
MDKVYVVGHKNPDTDSVCSAIVFAYLLNEWKKMDCKIMKVDKEAVPIIQGEPNAETKFVLEKFGFSVPEIMTEGEGKTVALVDHSDKVQSLDNIDKSEIVAVVDHHKIGDVVTPNPILFVNFPVGCTATVLKFLFDKTGVSLPQNMAGLLLASILSDTVIFKSATTTDMDKMVAEELAKVVGIEDITKFGIEVKAKLSDVSGMAVKDIIMRDYKDYNMSGKKVGVGQIELIDLSLIEGRREEIYNELQKMKSEGAYHSIVFMLTDIMKEGTDLMVITDDPSVIEKAFGKKLEGKSVWLDKVMSRKKQVVPPLEKAFAG